MEDGPTRCQKAKCLSAPGTIRRLARAPGQFTCHPTAQTALFFFIGYMDLTTCEVPPDPLRENSKAKAPSRSTSLFSTSTLHVLQLGFPFQLSERLCWGYVCASPPIFCPEISTLGAFPGHIYLNLQPRGPKFAISVQIQIFLRLRTHPFPLASPPVVPLSRS